MKPFTLAVIMITSILRLYYERADDKKKAKIKKITGIVAAVVAIVVVVIVISNQITKFVKYHKAVALMENGAYEDASELFTELGDYKDVKEIRIGAEKEVIKSVSARVGSEIGLGGLYWRVLTVEDNKALLITENIIAWRTNQEFFGIMSGWLNGEFSDGTFSEDERKLIDGEVMLLTREEVEKYFKTDKDRKATYLGRYDRWWVRTPDPLDWMCYVSADGSFNWILGSTVKAGVRPALWIDISDSNL